jgi:hypothetical protein
MNLCKDCKHFSPGQVRDCLRNERVIDIHPVNGEEIKLGAEAVELERGLWGFLLPFTPPWRCGKRGRFFEKKEPV